MGVYKKKREALDFFTNTLLSSEVKDVICCEKVTLYVPNSIFRKNA